MGTFALGDLSFDPRKVLFIHSLKTLVVSDLREALEFSKPAELTKMVESFDLAVEDFKPKSLVIIDSLKSPVGIQGIVKKWGKNAEIHFVASNPSEEALLLAESLHCILHQEFAWNQYRFTGSSEATEVHLGMTAIVNNPLCGIRLGNGVLNSHMTPVFLRGLGQIILPSFMKNKIQHSVFKPSLKLERYDVFAIGHKRVLPMGKVRDLKTKQRGWVKAVPVQKPKVKRAQLETL